MVLFHEGRGKPQVSFPLTLTLSRKGRGESVGTNW